MLCVVLDVLQERHHLLRVHLILATNFVATTDSLTQAEKRATYASLWCHQFAPLVPEPGDEQSLFARPAFERFRPPSSGAASSLPGVEVSFDALLTIACHQVHG